MKRHLIKSIAISVGLASFIYLLNGVFGTLEVLKSEEIISVWLAAALIGTSFMLYYTRMSDVLVKTIQFVVGVTAFTTIAVLNNWIASSPTDILIYAGITFIIMLIIFITFYFLSINDSKKINEKLNER